VHYLQTKIVSYEKPAKHINKNGVFDIKNATLTYNVPSKTYFGGTLVIITWYFDMYYMNNYS